MRIALHGILLAGCLGFVLLGAGSSVQANTSGASTGAPSKSAPGTNASLGEMESAFVGDKLSAREFLRFLREHRAQVIGESKPVPAQPVAAAPQEKPQPEPPKPGTAKPAPAQSPAAAAAPVQATPVAPPVTIAPAQPLIANTNAKPAGAPAVAAKPGATNRPPAEAQLEQSDDKEPELESVDQRLSELLRLKEARDRAAMLGTNLQAGPMTKRQRLDLLLRQFIQNKIDEKTFKEQREKILLEPEG